MNLTLPKSLSDMNKIFLFLILAFCGFLLSSPVWGPMLFEF